MSEKNSVYESMLNAPHLLVVGATGSGKSVLINALIYNILKEGPEKNQLVLIDPKRVELYPYKDCPHTLMYACDPDDMMESLRSVVTIMEERYDTMQKNHHKKSEEYNIYVIIDEYADLMDVCKKPAENVIIRLAQLGRAAGIHIIAATQNCTTQVVNTRIKSNFPARICLKTATVHDSINVIGSKGAEELPKHGKGYFLSGNDCSIVDINMVSDESINQLLDTYSGVNNPYKKASEEIPVDEKIIEKIIHGFGYKRLTSIKAMCNDYGLSPEEAERYAQVLIDRDVLKRNINSDRLSVVLKEEPEVEEEIIEDVHDEPEKIVIEEKVEELMEEVIEPDIPEEIIVVYEEPDERVEQIKSVVESQKVILEKLKDLVTFYFDDHSISFKAFKYRWCELGMELNETGDVLNKLEKECDEFLTPEEASQIRHFIEEANVFIDDVNENIKSASKLKRIKRWL